jgi:hypothetical protein
MVMTLVHMTDALIDEIFSFLSFRSHSSMSQTCHHMNRRCRLPSSAPAILTSITLPSSSSSITITSATTEGPSTMVNLNSDHKTPADVESIGRVTKIVSYRVRHVKLTSIIVDDLFPMLALLPTTLESLCVGHLVQPTKHWDVVAPPAPDTLALQRLTRLTSLSYSMAFLSPVSLFGSSSSLLSLTSYDTMSTAVLSRVCHDYPSLTSLSCPLYISASALTGYDDDDWLTFCRSAHSLKHLTFDPSDPSVAEPTLLSLKCRPLPLARRHLHGLMLLTSLTHLSISMDPVGKE